MLRQDTQAVASDREMIAMPLDSIIQAIQGVNNFLCCVRTPNLVENAIPYNAMPFWFSGELFQFSTHFTIFPVFNVPFGQTAVITGIGLGEHQPGLAAGFRVSLLINSETTPAFPRISGLLGLGTGMPLQTWIPVPESAQVALALDCPWIINTFAETPLEFGVQWSLRGYYMDKEFFVPSYDNSAVPQGMTPGTDSYPNINYLTYQIPEADTATTTPDNLMPTT
jgi:hypothetical protein